MPYLFVDILYYVNLLEELESRLDWLDIGLKWFQITRFRNLLWT